MLNTKSKLYGRKLADAKNWQEAKKILDVHGIKNPATRELSGLAYRMTDEKDKKDTLEKADAAMNQEMEEHGGDEHPGSIPAPKQKVEDETHGNKEGEINPRGGTEGSELHGNPSGSPGSDVPTPAKTSEKDQQNAKEQSGGDQLGGGNKENAMMGYPQQEMGNQYQVPTTMPTDLLNSKIIELMDPNNGNGMSQVAAKNAASNDIQGQMGMMQEALNPILKRIWDNHRVLSAQNQALKEAIDILKTGNEKGKISLIKTLGPGGANKEAIINLDPTVQTNLSELSKINDDPLAKAEFQRNLSHLYS